MKFINDLNLKKQAKELGIGVWQTPSFLFLMMGILIIIAMTATYYISKNYNNPEILILTESFVVATIFVIGNSIIQGVEQMAKLNKLKSEFVSVASHQLRTPLSAIRWETELLLSKFNQGLNEKQKEGLESISSLSGRMTRLVSDLLDVARIEQGKMLLKNESINLDEIMKKIIHDFSTLAKAKNSEIIFENSGKPALIIGDSEKLRMVIENILGNSIKYTVKKGEIRILIYRKGDYFVVSIKDNGVGIPEFQQNQVFNKFFRSDNVVKYQTEGTGLGLYIAKRIIEQSGGKIWFKSIENKGTEFCFSLPINK